MNADSWQRDFQPQYPRTECLVGVDILVGQAAREPAVWPFNEILREVEPNVFLPSARVLSHGEGYRAYLQYATDCERRVEITQLLVRTFEARHRGIRLVVLADPVEPGPDTLDARGFWTDDPDYDPERWRLLRRAMHGDADALLILGNDSLSKGDFDAAYQALGLAADRLPEGPSRELARAGRDRALEGIDPEYRDRARAALAKNNAGIQ